MKQRIYRWIVFGIGFSMAVWATSCGVLTPVLVLGGQ
jgi:hypothetical protein